MAEEGAGVGTLRPSASRPVHGGVKPSDLRALGLNPEEVHDFSASISPIGPPEGVWDALRGVDLSAYPDPHCLELREALSRHLSLARPKARPITVDRILVGNGSTELIHLLARANLSPPRQGTENNALLLAPTYGEYLGACHLMGAPVVSLTAQESAGFRWDLAEAVRLIKSDRPSLVFLCNPNNPTGVFLGATEVEELAEATIGVGGLLVVDEAYISFVDRPWDALALAERRDIVLLRSMTKDYALTALRLGYCLASEETIHRMSAFQPDWSVNGLAQAAGLAALADADYLPRARQAVAEAKEYLTAQLQTLEFAVLPSAANFLMVKVGDAGSWRDMLMRRGIFVRDCSSFGLPQYLRLGIRALPDCQRMVEVMKQLA